MLRILPEERKSNWADSLNKVVHAYNCTRNDATGFAPFFLLFGRAPRLPIDQIFELCHQPKSASYPKYVKQWATAMKDAYEIVEKRTGNHFKLREQERQFKLREQEIELQKLELQSKAAHLNPTHARSHFDFTKHIRMVPPFQEREVDKFFFTFRKSCKKLCMAERTLDNVAPKCLDRESSGYLLRTFGRTV